MKGDKGMAERQGEADVAKCDRGRADASSDVPLWLEFEIWEKRDSDDPFDDCFNMRIDLLDGNAYALNVWTYHFLQRAIQNVRKNGECCSGAYLEPPDLFVERMDRTLLEATVQDLIASDKLRPEWLVDSDGE